MKIAATIAALLALLADGEARIVAPSAPMGASIVTLSTNGIAVRAGAVCGGARGMDLQVYPWPRVEEAAAAAWRRSITIGLAGS